MSEQPVEPDLRPPADDAEALRLLRDGELDLEGRLVDASNATLYCTIRSGDVVGECVYKPVAGERPLWDFPDGTLAGREVSAYLVSRGDRLGRRAADGAARGAVRPGHGASCGSTSTRTSTCAAFVRRDDPALRRMAVFDAVVNNADRKGGHLIPMPDGHVYGVDHGVCFSVDPKLRTLLWRWAGKPLPGRGGRGAGAAGRRAARRPGRAAARAPDPPRGAGARSSGSTELLRTGRHPEPSGDWPALPWPPF